MKATLNYGHQIPLNGFGTFSLTGDEGQATLRSALEAGYRLMDTASIYGNERDLGAVLSSTDIPRSEIYVISKAWPSQYRDLREACLGSLERLQTDYIDLYLLHWPFTYKDDTPHREEPKPLGSTDLISVLDNFPLQSAWRQMESLVHEGLCQKHWSVKLDCSPHDRHASLLRDPSCLQPDRRQPV